MRVLQPAYGEFLNEFLGNLFLPQDQVRIAVLHGPKDMRNQLLLRDQAVARLLELASASTPNLYFAGCAFAPTGTYTKQDVLSTRCLCLDIDYGTTGHRAKPFFENEEDAWACLMTSPITPAGVWHTGHGLQACYLLDQPYVFTGPDSIAEYESVSSTLARMVQSDATFTPEHLFRVPLTINAKENTRKVKGELLYWNPGTRYAFTQLQAICAQYGVPPEPETEQVPVAETDNAMSVPYTDLPEDLRDEIEMSHPDRSDAMFGIVLRMIKAGYAPDVIQDAVAHGQDFKSKYGNRLKAEVGRCIAKIRQAPHVYFDVRLPLDVVNVAGEVLLADCPGLSPDMDSMLGKYAEVSGFTLSGQVSQVRKAARFHEHLFASHRSGVMETPCGYGKSTWALCHIALNALNAFNANHTQYLYVVDTLDGLYRAAEVIEKLNPDLSVGRYHSFNPERCRDLCGRTHTWEQCNPRDSGSVCRKCGVHNHCAFFNRDQELRKPAVVMCHAGFVRLLESEDAEPLLEQARILIDEDLNAYLNAEFDHADLLLVEQLVGSIGLSIKPLFPYTSFASAGTPYGIQPGAVTYAAIHYVYRNERETSSLGGTVQALRKALGTGKLDLKAAAGQIEHARQVLCELLALFRPGYRGDTSYAYREVRDVNAQSQVRYVVKKSRFNLGSAPVGERLWILNASARLSPYPYPENMPVFQCPNLPPEGYQVSLHVIAGNPMHSRHQAHVATACKIIRMICLHREHKAVFIATDKGKGAKGTKGAGAQDIAAAVRDSFGAATAIVHLERGRIRGSNEAGECTFACLAGLSLFTTVDNVVAAASILTRRTIPVIPAVFFPNGSLDTPGGRFKLKIMREIYALSALDELYQTLWRTAVRNNGRVEGIVVVPDAEWLSILWRTVMPGFRTHAVHKPSARGFKIDLSMDGMVFLMGVAPGREFQKQDVAKLLGYRGKDAWKENKARIMHVLGPFFEEGENVQMLKRRVAFTGTTRL